jgi:hypothetical protein
VAIVMSTRMNPVITTRTTLSAVTAVPVISTCRAPYFARIFRWLARIFPWFASIRCWLRST